MNEEVMQSVIINQFNILNGDIDGLNNFIKQHTYEHQDYYHYTSA